MYSFVIDNKFLKGDITCKIHFYVSAVCEHNHPTIIKIHSLFFLIPQKPKQSQLSSRFDSEAPPTAADRLSCISIFPPSAMSRRQCRFKIIHFKNILKDHYRLGENGSYENYGFASLTTNWRFMKYEDI